MKVLFENIHTSHKKSFNILKDNINVSVISDVNHSSNLYSGELNFLNEMNLCKSDDKIDTHISRLIGNVTPHTDYILEYKRKVYLLILDISNSYQYMDSQKEPLLFEGNTFLKIKKGDFIEFNQFKEHALFWDKRIDIATFWTYR